VTFNVPDWVLHVAATLEQNGHSAYFVGGCVRDTYLSRAVHDYDVATSAHPQSVQAMFPHTVATGIQHGTVTVIAAPSQHVEVTTFRTESRYSDGRRPDAVAFTNSIRADLSRRDFTMNAIAVDLHGRWVDPFAGRADLDARVIRAVGAARTRFHEDALRILRALRLAAELRFDISVETMDGMRACAKQLANVSTERIGNELSRLAKGDWTRVAVPLADGPWLDELPAPWPQMRQSFVNFAALPEHQQVAWRTAVATSSQVGARLADTVATWLALQTQEETLQPFAFRVSQMYRVLAWPTRDVPMARDAAWMALEDPATWSPLRWRKALYACGAETVLRACRIADWQYRDGAANTCSRVAKQRIAEQSIWRTSDLAIDGRDVQGLGADGRTIGQAIAHLVEDVLTGNLVNRRDVLMLAAKAYIDEEHANR